MMAYKNIEDKHAYNHKYQKELRGLRKRLGVCLYCGREDARTLIGKSMCFDCFEKSQITKKKHYQTESYEREKAKRAEAIKKRQEYRKENSLCTRCGKRKPEDGYKTCKSCRAKIARSRKSKSKCWAPQSERSSYGFCVQCGKPLDGALKVDGTPAKLCIRCYNLSCSKLIEARKVWSEKHSGELRPPYSNSEKAWKKYAEMKKARKERNGQIVSEAN